MSEAFIIMQIGSPKMDAVCDGAMVPAIEAAGFVARRVDRHNTGDLLKSEIVAFIERSDIIVADLTNERPNCYLEVGYAMGLGKKKNLILTAREDHHHGSSNHVKGGPKIHFDLEGYDILFWDPEKLDDFQAELQKRISRRFAIVQTSTPNVPSVPGGVPAVVALDTEWRDSQRAHARQGIVSLGLNGYMEAQVAVSAHGDWSQQTLLHTVEAANIHTFGWPIGLVLNRDPHRPRPTAGGVVAEVSVSPSGDGWDRSSYDYWSILRNGDFYMLKSLFEDSQTVGDQLFFDTRVVQTTELLMFLARLYTRLEMSPTSQLKITVKYGGLANRRLRAAGNRHVFERRSTTENEIETTLECSLQDLDAKLVENVKSLLEPLFMLFDFFELSDQIYTELVDNFVNGKIT